MYLYCEVLVGYACYKHPAYADEAWYEIIEHCEFDRY